MKPEEARAALEDVARVKSRLTQRVAWPLWRHLLAGLVSALLVGGSAFTGWPMFIAYAAVVVLAALIVWLDRRYSGMFVSGYRGARTKWAMLASAAVTVAGVGAIYLLPLQPPTDPIFIGVIAVVLAGTTAASIWWERLYRAELSAKERP